MQSCWVLSGMISVSIRLAWQKALHEAIVTIFRCCYYYFLCFFVLFLKVRFVSLAFMQASGSMSPRMQLLRERAAIHGSISHVSLNAILSSDYMYALQRNFCFCICSNIFSIFFDVRNEMLRFFSGTTWINKGMKSLVKS